LNNALYCVNRKIVESCTKENENGLTYGSDEAIEICVNSESSSKINFNKLTSINSGYHKLSKDNSLKIWKEVNEELFVRVNNHSIIDISGKIYIHKLIYYYNIYIIFLIFII